MMGGLRVRMAAFLHKQQQAGLLCRLGQGLPAVRPARWRYLFILSLGTVLTNTQGRFFEGFSGWLGLDAATLFGLCFFAGAGVLFALVDLQRPAQAAHWAAALTALGFLLWLALPAGALGVAAGLALAAGLGCCAAIAVYAFVRCLNPSERFVGAALTALFNMLAQTGYSLGAGSAWAARALLGLLVGATALCLGAYRQEDFQAESPRPGRSAPAMPLMVLFFLSFMVMEIFYTSLPLAASRQALLVSALSGILAVGMSLALYFMLRTGAWYICSIYFVATLAAFAAYLVGGEQSALLPRYVLHGFGQTGFIVGFYLFGQVMAGSPGRSYKARWLLLMGLSAAAVPLPQWLLLAGSASYIRQALMVVFTLFMAYILLLPAFVRHLFVPSILSAAPAAPVAPQSPAAASSGREAQREAYLQQQGLTPREMQVTRCLLMGRTARQCAAELNISEDTVKYHMKRLYRKLQINGRAELFSLLDRLP